MRNHKHRGKLEYAAVNLKKKKPNSFFIFILPHPGLKINYKQEEKKSRENIFDFQLRTWTGRPSKPSLVG